MENSTLQPSPQVQLLCLEEKLRFNFTPSSQKLLLQMLSPDTLQPKLPQFRIRAQIGDSILNVLATLACQNIDNSSEREAYRQSLTMNQSLCSKLLRCAGDLRWHSLSS